MSEQLTYTREALSRVIRERNHLRDENARLQHQVEVANALADAIESAFPEYEPTEDDRDKAWFSIGWVRDSRRLLLAYRATMDEEYRAQREEDNEDKHK